jgi:hypothetical protein
MIGARIFIIIAMLVPIFFSASCSTIDSFLERESHWQTGTVMLRKGYAAFGDGEYRAAAEIFEKLRGSSQDREIARKALFGLAGARLAMAETPDAYTDALSLLDDWARSLPQELRDEDSRMLVPALVKAVSGPSPSINRQEAAARHKTLRLLRGMERENQQLKGQLESRDKEIENLKQKIEMIQSIDQKIQEKKKEISLP